MKKLIIRLWLIWECVFEKINGIIYISDDNLFRIALKRYRGKEKYLSDGTAIKKGDEYIELHLNNKLLRRINTFNPVVLLRSMKRSMSELAQLLCQERYMNINVIMGITLLNRGLEKFGFEIEELNALVEKVVSIYEGTILVLFHKDGIKRLKEGRKMVAKRIFLSRKRLFAQYLTGGCDEISK